MDTSTTSDVVGGEYFVRSLQEFTRSTDRRIAELSFEKAELNAKIVQLENIIDAKDAIIKEYLRRVALLEFALKKERLGRNPAPTVVPPASVLAEEIPLRKPERKGPSCREILKKYLDELGELTMPSAEEIAATQTASAEGVKDVIPSTKPDEFAEEEEPVSDIPSPKLICKLSCSLAKSRRIVLSPKGMLAVASDDGLIKIWADVHTIREADLRTASSFVNTVNPNLVLRGTGFPVSAMVCSDSHLVSGDSAGNLSVFRITDLHKLELFPNTVDLDTATVRHHVMSAHESVVSLAIHPSAALMASSGSEGTVKLWKLTTSPELYLEFSDHEFTCISAPTALIWHPTNANKLVVGLRDGTLQCIDVAAGAITTRCSHGSSEILALAATSLGECLCISQADGSVKLVDAASLTCVRKMEPLAFGVVCHTIISSHENRLITGWADGCLRLMSGQDLEPIASLNAHAAIDKLGVTDVALGEGVTASTGADGRVCIFNSLWYFHRNRLYNN